MPDVFYLSSVALAKEDYVLSCSATIKLTLRLTLVRLVTLLSKIENLNMYHNHDENEKQNLLRLSALIEGFTKTGLEMFENTMNSKEILKTDMASFLLFRQTLEMGDALSTLIKLGCVNASKPLVRTLLECYFQLAYLFKENEERKAYSFFITMKCVRKNTMRTWLFQKRGKAILKN